MYVHQRDLYQRYRRQRGMSLIELLGAIGIGAVLLMGLVALIDNALEDSKGQQASLYQAQVSEAAAKYIAANYASIKTATAGGNLFAINLATLQSGAPGATSFLPASFRNTNVYGQNTCVLVRQPVTDQLNALVVSYGGMPIGDKDIPVVAANAGKGGGYISSAAFTQMQGTSWTLPSTDYRGAACAGGGGVVLNGTAADGGHLVSMIFQQGQAAADFLYRHDIDGMPEATTMNATIKMAGAAVVTEGSACGVVSAIGVSNTGLVLSCQANVWTRQGAGTWKEPVDNWAALNATTDNTSGDVRMVKEMGRAFMWNGAKWVGLAADENNNLTLNNLDTQLVNTQLVNLNKVVNTGDTCDKDGQIARDGTGKLLNCYSGIWHSMQESRMGDLVYNQLDTVYPSEAWRENRINLAALPGPRPVFATGYAHCQASSGGESLVSIEIHDAADNVIGWAGGCGNINANAGNVRHKSFVPLQRLPDNAASLVVQLLSKPGGPDDYVDLTLQLYNSR